MSNVDTKAVAIVTGGSRGLGKNIALHLARKGADVILTYQSKQSEAESVVAEIGAQGGRAASLQLDVSNTGSFAAFAETINRLLQEKWNRADFDYLVNNAGVGHNASLMEMKEADFDRLVNIHFKSTFFLTQRLLPLMRDGGRILNMSSGLARFASPGFSVYGSLKGAVEVLTRYMAKELGPRRITVNVLAPGAIETDFGGGVVRDNSELNRMIAEQTPLGRVGVPDDIGGAVSALLSDDCRWINGQRIEVSGGIGL